jgi:predicted naringenin-chalcone synthase
MSSASIIFTLRELLRTTPHAAEPQPGRAIAFGPGLTVETMDFTRMPAPRQTRTKQVAMERRRLAVEP